MNFSWTIITALDFSDQAEPEVTRKYMSWLRWLTELQSFVEFFYIYENLYHVEY